MSRHARAVKSRTPAAASPGSAIRREWLALAVVLLLGLLVRLWAMHWPPFPNDIISYIGWGERIRDVGPRAFYSESVFADYAPGYIYVFWVTSWLQHAVFPNADVTTVHLLYRLPPVLCDLATTALIFLVVLRASRGRIDTAADAWPLLETVIAACYAFNPAIILNSAAWGQTDSVFTLFMLLALVLLMRGRPEAGILSYTVAFLVKPQAISLAPLLGVALLMYFPPRRVALAVAAGVALGVVLLFPFFGVNMVPRLIRVLRDATDTYPYTSLFAYNIWGVYGFWKPDTVTVGFGLSARALGMIVYILGVLVGTGALAWSLRRTTDRLFTLLIFAVYFTFLPVVVLTRMHERYLYPVLPFLLLLAAVCQIRQEEPESTERPRFLLVPLLLYVGLTVLHTMNLYQVYQYYQHFNTGGPPVTNRLFYRIDGAAKVWSVLTVLSFTTFVVFIPSWLPGHSMRRSIEPEAGPDPTTVARPGPA